jgi:hypothetical protein
MAASSSLPRWAQGLLDFDKDVRSFVEFAQQCEHRVVNRHGSAGCRLSQPSSGCGPAFCPIFQSRVGDKDEEK